ncbi:MAG: hypothetical protein J7497_09590, partial [Chitinophagaceae bacterium]|nr:hypothetical protein [Chitinophagaceae bacterium]
MKKINRISFLIPSLIIYLIILLPGCRKFVQIDTPPDKITQANVYSTDRTAISVLTGIYADLCSTGANMAEYTGLLADEWNIWSMADMEHQSHYLN